MDVQDEPESEERLPSNLTAAERDAWTAALRSGEYKQGQSALKRNLIRGGCEFCCLGVLREINPGNESFRAAKAQAQYMECGVNADIESRLWLVDDKLDRLVQQRLAGMNDDGAHNFLDIANFIDKNLDVVE